MAREDLHFRLRLPEQLKAKIEEAAAAHHRSMTAEIVARLEESFELAEAAFAHGMASGAVEGAMAVFSHDLSEIKAVLQELRAESKFLSDEVMALHRQASDQAKRDL